MRPLPLRLRLALVETAGDTEPDPETLAAHCRTTLAGYKVPKYFLVLESMQRSPAGKADYTLLRGIARERLAGGTP